MKSSAETAMAKIEIIKTGFEVAQAGIIEQTKGKEDAEET